MDQTTAVQAAVSLQIESDAVAWIVFDTGTDRPNLLTAAVLARLDALLAEVEEGVRAGRVRALVVRSGRAGSFIAGADVNEIGTIAEEAAGAAGARAGQQIFLRLDRLPIPVLVAIDGICLGGGLELALACDYRLASERRETRLGVPEVKLGIIPGFGGTTRLPRLIGLRAALDLILTGRTVDARRAQKLGLVHECVHPAQLYQRARAAAIELAEGRHHPTRRRTLSDRLLDDTGPGRRLVFARARQRVLKETRGHYPAPLEALQVIAASHGEPLEKALAAEAAAVGRLLAGPVSHQLIHVFHLLEGAKKTGPRGAAARPVSHAAVVGAGVMGGGIAQLLAGRGVAVRMKDIRAEALGSGLRHARQLFERALRRRRIDRRELQRSMDRIAPTLDYSGFARADLVIEAVLERVDVKQQVLHEVESQVSEHCVLTTNTSSLPLAQLERALERPQNFCGMHFFNPVHRMPLVEVIRGPHSSDETIATVVSLVRRLDKVPVIVRDGPGFLVNRILAPYLNEAGWLLMDGAGIEQIDRALIEFGMPMGPLRLLDEVGLDVARHVGRILHDAFGARMAPPPCIAALEHTPLLGRKSGAGFYRYAGERQGDVHPEVLRVLREHVRAGQPAPAADVIRERTVFAMIGEAARALEEGVVSSAGDVDVALITGTRFPPFRGGLLRYADSLGVREVLARLERLEQTHGERFTPAPLLRQLAARGRGFYHV